MERSGSATKPDNPMQPGVPDAQDQAALDLALRKVPTGAVALAGLTVFLLLVFWFVVYLMAFLPRGLVG